MKQFCLMGLSLFLTSMSMQAKSWKVGPSSVVGMDFTSINAAMSGVSAGDTLYLDQFYNESDEQNVTKRVVIIGTGYDTSQTDEQVVAQLTNNLNLKANKVVVKSVKLSSVYFHGDDCTVERCYATFMKGASSTADTNHIYSCYIAGHIKGYDNGARSKFDIQNNVIIKDGYDDNINYLTSSIIANNVIIQTNNWCRCLAYIDNTRIVNNIILHTDSYNCDFGDGTLTQVWVML